MFHTIDKNGINHWDLSQCDSKAQFLFMDNLLNYAANISLRAYEINENDLNLAIGLPVKRVIRGGFPQYK